MDSLGFTLSALSIFSQSLKRSHNFNGHLLPVEQLLVVQRYPRTTPVPKQPQAQRLRVILALMTHTCTGRPYKLLYFSFLLETLRKLLWALNLKQQPEMIYVYSGEIKSGPFLICAVHIR